MKQIVALSILLLAASELVAQEWIWQNPLPTGNYMNAVFAVTPTICVAVGAYGTVIRTEDGGQHWANLPQSINTNWYDVYFRDPAVGWIVGGVSG